MPWPAAGSLPASDGSLSIRARVIWGKIQAIRNTKIVSPRSVCTPANCSRQAVDGNVSRNGRRSHWYEH